MNDDGAIQQAIRLIADEAPMEGLFIFNDALGTAVRAIRIIPRVIIFQSRVMWLCLLLQKLLFLFLAELL